MTNNKRLTFGIDIDGTVTDPASIVPFMNQSFGKNLTLADCFDYNLAKVYGISDDAFTQWLIHNGTQMYQMAPIHGQAADVLRSWYTNHQLVYISARTEADRDVTLDWFSRHEIPYHHIDLVGSHNKLEAAKRWTVDVFIEDRLENALQLSEGLSIPVFLFDTPYNQATLPPLVHRVSGWDEIARKMETMVMEQTLP